MKGAAVPVALHVVLGFKRNEKLYQTRGFLQIAGVLVSGWWLLRSAKPINAQCFARVGSIGWQCVWHLPVGCVCVGAKKD